MALLKTVLKVKVSDTHFKEVYTPFLHLISAYIKKFTTTIIMAAGYVLLYSFKKSRSVQLFRYLSSELEHILRLPENSNFISEV